MLNFSFISVNIFRSFVKFSCIVCPIAETTARFKSTKPDNLNRLDSDTGRDQLFHPEVWIKTVLNSQITAVTSEYFSLYCKISNHKAKTQKRVCVLFYFYLGRSQTQIEKLRRYSGHACPLGRSSEKKLPADFLF